MLYPSGIEGFKCDARGKGSGALNLFETWGLGNGLRYDHGGGYSHFVGYGDTLNTPSFEGFGHGMGTILSSNDFAQAFPGSGDDD